MTPHIPSTHPELLPAARVLVVAVVLLLTAACTGNDSETPEASRAEPSTPVPSIPESEVPEVVENIPLDGTDKAPLHWRIPYPGLNEDYRNAVLTARRYKALSIHLGTLRKYGPAQARWFAAVADGQQLEENYSIHSADEVTDDPTVGPLWLWVDAPLQVGEDAMLVRICEDGGWHTRQSKQDTLPDPADHRSTMHTYRVEKTHPDAEDEQYAWRVTFAALGNPQPDGSPFDRQCLNWADHTPPNNNAS